MITLFIKISLAFNKKKFWSLVFVNKIKVSKIKVKYVLNYSLNINFHL